MTENGIKFGVSSFCYSTEFYHGKMTLSDCLRETKAAGAEGFELVGSHHMPGFPTPNEQWLRDFRAVGEALGVQIHCYATHVDRGRRTDRQLTDDEMLQSTIKDLEYARLLGAEMIRTQYILRPRMMERILPWAERFKVKVGVEMHPPHRLDRPVWIEFMDTFRRLNSPFIGIIVDFGCFQDKPPKGWAKPYVDIGVPPQLAEEIMTAHSQKQSKEEIAEKIRQSDAGYFAGKMLDELYEWYQPCDEKTFRDFRESLPYAIEIHGKFFDIVNGKEELLPYDRLLSIMQEEKYSGYLTSEFEGFFLKDQVDSVRQVRDHIEMEKRILERYPRAGI